MSKSLRILATAVCLICVLIHAPALRAVHADAEAPSPLVFVDEPFPSFSDGPMDGLAEKGISLDLLKAVCGRMGYGVHIKLMPFARALKTVRQGQADGIPLLVNTKERRRFLVFTSEIVHGREFFYYNHAKRKDFQWSGYADLKGLSIGLVRGYTYTESFESAVKQYGLNVEYVSDSELNLGKLAAGRIDVALEDEFLFRAVMEAHPQWRDALRPSPKPVSTYGWSMGISKRSPLARRVEEINRILHDMRRDGQLDAIIGQR
ncbi:MAG: substrate-binding periplasmic protein [Desulfovibrionaceae bacterium]